MKETIKKLWREYLAEENATMDDEERELTKNAARLHEEMNGFLISNEAYTAVEKHLEALYELSALTEEKAFIKGCEFAISFLLDAGGFEIHATGK